jgi:hypothetical protein
VIASLVLASVAVGCQDTDGNGNGKGPGAKTPDRGRASQSPGGGSGHDDGKESAKPSPRSSDRPAGGLTCDQLRNAELQNSELRLPDAPAGSISFTDGRWEGDGIVIELQPQCDIGDMTGDAAPDAVAPIKVTTEGTGRFYALVTWRNDAGTPVPAAAASLGDRTPVESVEISTAPPKQATVAYLTRGDADPAAVVTIRRTAVYRVAGPVMAELHHSDAPYTP